ncbi:MAG: hypothetical protein JNL30_04265 [Rubrivivax sp.]|nr:hypothetical protein [Rubrivivax sp.]
MKIEYAARLPRSLPAKARVYALAAPRTDHKQLQALADGLGLRAAPAEWHSSAVAVGAQMGRWSLAMHRASGALRLVHLDRHPGGDDETFELSDRRAQGAAARFVSRLSLLPKAEAKAVAVTHLRQAGGPPDGKAGKERILDAGVVYARRIDDLPVIGPGGMAMVNVAGDGQVVGARRIWRTLGRRMATVALQPADWAMETFESALARQKLLGDVKVLKAQLGYLEFGELDAQTLIEPAYAFVYRVQHGEVASKHVHVMHAGEKGHGKLMGPRRFVAGKQRARKATEGK